MEPAPERRDYPDATIFRIALVRYIRRYVEKGFYDALQISLGVSKTSISKTITGTGKSAPVQMAVYKRARALLGYQWQTRYEDMWPGESEANNNG